MPIVNIMYNEVGNYPTKHVTVSGVARPGPTRACVLPSIFQALSSPAQQESYDSITN